MIVEIKIPELGESITEATIAEWLKAPGEAVAQDEAIANLDTDKVAVELNAPEAGVLVAIVAEAGATVSVGQIVARIDTSAKAAAKTPASDSPKDAPIAEAASASSEAKASLPLSPAVRRMLSDFELTPQAVTGTGKGGRITKADVIQHLRSKASSTGPVAETKAGSSDEKQRIEERVKMTRLRKTIARRLKEAQNTAAMLSTFNDVDMSNVIAARSKYKDLFAKKHDIRLGFMSFFVKASCLALQDVPAVNAAIDGDDLVYRNYADIGIAVSTPTGLIVPVLRDADRRSFQDCEKAIADFGARARKGAVRMDELQGGSFTITNGGVFGSLLSTPILNPPQAAILGMHRIEERPVVRNGEIVIRPMMYLALTYDHRLIDGREAVTFLLRVKEAIEDPTRLLIDM